jgi:hypothetical protein
MGLYDLLQGIALLITFLWIDWDVLLKLSGVSNCVSPFRICKQLRRLLGRSNVTWLETLRQPERAPVLRRALSWHLCTDSQSKASGYVARAHENFIGNGRHTVAEGSYVTFWEPASSILIQGDSFLLSEFQCPINGNPDNNLESPCNCRSVSRLTSFSKIFERIILSGLKQHIYDHNIIFNEQFGFRRQTSTTKVSYVLINEILKTFNKQKIVGGILCDLKKGFWEC